MQKYSRFRAYSSLRTSRCAPAQGHAGNLPLLRRWTLSSAAASSVSACARRWARPAAPPWSAFLAALALPSAVRGPVDAAHGFQLAISAACLARAASVHLGMMLSLKSSFWCAVRSYSVFCCVTDCMKIPPTRMNTSSPGLCALRYSAFTANLFRRLLSLVPTADLPRCQLDNAQGQLQVAHFLGLQRNPAQHLQAVRLARDWNAVQLSEQPRPCLVEHGPPFGVQPGAGGALRIVRFDALSAQHQPEFLFDGVDHLLRRLEARQLSEDMQFYGLRKSVHSVNLVKFCQTIGRSSGGRQQRYVAGVVEDAGRFVISSMAPRFRD